MCVCVCVCVCVCGKYERYGKFGSFEKYVCEFGVSAHWLAQCGCIKHSKAVRSFMNH